VFSPGPVLVGHRGNGRGPDENTLGAFQAGVAAQLTWVEADVRCAGDDTLVLAHAPFDAQGRPYSQLTGEQCRAGGLLLLDELLEVLPPGIGLNLDLKSAVEDALRVRGASSAALLAPVAERQRSVRPLLVSSFDPAALLIVRECAPGVPLGLLTWRDFPLRKSVPAAVHLGCDVVAGHTGSFALAQGEQDAAYVVDVAHRAGLDVLAWCPSPEAAPALLSAGVDALCIDDVPGVRAAIWQA